MTIFMVKPSEIASPQTQSQNAKLGGSSSTSLIISSTLGIGLFNLNEALRLAVIAEACLIILSVTCPQSCPDCARCQAAYEKPAP
ncbi:hypothetical protein IE4872_PD00361 (plasmid) [Rhizobium gallicum]|uniref:Uncharacterized protein n=1 Tax=Rhizobium gallicum TaxID=56730 RepID=A0A1L5NSL7_9HYPH|nr:hypothetical protein IE4872_PD00361 [Rhizobium gallicum]